MRKLNTWLDMQINYKITYYYFVTNLKNNFERILSKIILLVFIYFLFVLIYTQQMYGHVIRIILIIVILYLLWWYVKENELLMYSAFDNGTDPAANPGLPSYMMSRAKFTPEQQSGKENGQYNSARHDPDHFNEYVRGSVLTQKDYAAHKLYADEVAPTTRGASSYDTDFDPADYIQFTGLYRPTGVYQSGESPWVTELGQADLNKNKKIARLS